MNETTLTHPNFVALLLVLLLAVAVPLLFRRLQRFRIPVVVGEILTGILIGRSGLGLVSPEEPVLALLGEIGFVFLMFLAGMEIDLSLLGIARTPKDNPPPEGANPRTSEKAPGPNPLVLALEHFLLTLVLAGGAAYFLWRTGMARNLPLMALIISTTSLGVVMPVLKEQGWLHTRYGQTLLITALVADFATMVLITLQVALIAHGLTLEVLLIGLLFVALFVLYRLGDVVLPGLRTALDELSHATTQIKVRLAFLMLAAFAALAQVLGAEIILGAFLAGLLVALLTEPEDEPLRHQLESMGYGFFVPIFFIMVGANFNLQALLRNPRAWAVLGVLLVAAVVTKVVPAVVFRQGFSWRESLAGGALLSARLSLIIAAAEIGLGLGVLREEVVAAVILVAVVTVVFSPWVFTQAMGRRTDESSPGTLIIGADSLGLRVAHYFHTHHHPFKLVDEDAQRVARAQKLGFPAYQATPSGQSLTQLERCTEALITHTTPARIVAWARLLRQQLGLERVVALSPTAETERALRALHVHPITPLDAQATLLALAMRNPDLLQLLTDTEDDRDICEVRMEHPSIHGRRLRDLALPPRLLVLSIHRDEAYIIPRGDTVLQQGDTLTLLGTPEDLERFIQTWVRSKGAD